MYSKGEASRLRQEFWTQFGQYMKPVLSTEGERVNWINYKTGEKDIFFKMITGNDNATIGIVITHEDESIRKLYFEQFRQLEKLLNTELEEEWIWEMEATDENGKGISRIYYECKNVSILKKEDWPALISFFKPRMIALDAFWNNSKYVFESLR